MILARWSRPHYGAHLAPILAALPDWVGPDALLVASHRDLVGARRVGSPRRRILAQHGAGQSYTKPLAAYPGGVDNDDVGLFLVPNEDAAARWRKAYPGACVEVVGSPILDELPAKEPGPVTIAVSFHWNAVHTPEAGSAFRWFAGAVERLSTVYDVIGHSHPLRHDLTRWYSRRGIEVVPSFADVCRRANVFVADNTSSLFEFASTGRGVVVLDSPRYRPETHHGLRFWDAADVGVRISDPDTLEDAVALALSDPEPVRRLREQALDIVYAHRTGAAQRAADAITEWLS